MAFYKVEDLDGKEADRLVEAPNAAQAIRHCAQRYKATALGTAEVAEMLVASVTLERATAKADATQAAIRG